MFYELLDFLPFIYKLRNSTLKFIVSMSKFINSKD